MVKTPWQMGDFERTEPRWQYFSGNIITLRKSMFLIFCLDCSALSSTSLHFRASHSKKSTNRHPTFIPVVFARQRASLSESHAYRIFAKRGARMQACRWKTRAIKAKFKSIRLSQWSHSCKKNTTIKAGCRSKTNFCNLFIQNTYIRRSRLNCV